MVPRHESPLLHIRSHFKEYPACTIPSSTNYPRNGLQPTYRTALSTFGPFEGNLACTGMSLVSTTPAVLGFPKSEKVTCLVQELSIPRVFPIYAYLYAT